MKWWKKLINTLSSESEKESEQPAVLPSEHTCFHESGHYMVAWLFPEDIRINELNVNKTMLPGDWNGGILMTKISPNSTAGFDQLMLAVSGGIAAATILSNGAEYVSANLSRFPRDTKGLDTFGGDGDYKAIKAFSTQVGFAFSIQPTYVMWTGFQLIFLYLMEPLIWQAVSLIAGTLKVSRHRRITHTEIEALLSKNLNVEELRKIATAYKNYRYPLTYDKLITLLPDN
jgi:hypothetical protein